MQLPAYSLCVLKNSLQSTYKLFYCYHLKEFLCDTLGV